METKAEKISLKKAQGAVKEGKENKKAKKAATDAKTAKVVKDKIKKEKEPMYRYPEDVTDAPGKKHHRAKMRREKEAWFKKLRDASAEKKPKMLRKANSWAAENYNKGYAPIFE